MLRRASRLWELRRGRARVLSPYVGIGGAGLIADCPVLLGMWRLGAEVPITKRIAALLEGRGFAVPGARGPAFPVLALRVR